MKVLSEFREFALRGSVVDLAVGIIIGTAFGAVVKGLVDEVIMPVVGMFLGGFDLSNRKLVLQGGDRLQGNETVAQAREAGATVIGYGQFLNLVITFLIVAIAVFFVVKGINRMRRKQAKTPDPEAQTRPCPECTTQVAKAALRCPACTAPIAPLPPPTPS